MFICFTRRSITSLRRAAAAFGAAALAACASRPPAPGFEVQAYPAGVIPGVHAQWELDESSALTARVAGNFTDRQDFGEHDDERGGGFGAGLGYRRYLGSSREGWLWGARVDLWRLGIDWVDDPGTALRRSGSTDITVLQPSFELGYGMRLGESDWRVEWTLGLGAEINIDTDGEDVGEGAILLLGATLVRSF